MLSRSMRASAFAGLAVSASVAASTATAQDAGLYISLVDNLGVEVNGQGSFNDETVILVQGGVPSAFFEIDLGDLDAFHILDNGNYLLSSLTNGNVGGNTFLDGDLIEYDPINNDIVGNYLGLGEGSFTAGFADVDAATTDADGNLYFSMLSDVTLAHAGGSLDILDGDVVRLDATTGIATIFISEADIFDDGQGDLYGIHWLGDGHLLLTHNDNDGEVVDGTSFLDGDIFLYEIATGAASLFFGESNFTSSLSHDVDAIYFVVPAPGAAAVLAAGGLFAARRRRA